MPESIRFFVESVAAGTPFLFLECVDGLGHGENAEHGGKPVRLDPALRNEEAPEEVRFVEQIVDPCLGQPEVQVQVAGQLPCKEIVLTARA